MIPEGTHVMVKDDMEKYGVVVGNKKNFLGYPIVVIRFWDSVECRHYEEDWAEAQVYPS